MGAEIAAEQDTEIEVRVEVGDPAGVEECFHHLVEGLGDRNIHVRQLAVCGLAASGDPRAVDHLIGALDDDRPEVRTRAASVLGRLGDPVAAPHLIRAAQSHHLVVHRAALAALGELGELGEVTVAVLARELREREPADRVRAAVALGETRAIAAIEPLTSALGDDDPTVRLRAREALEKILRSAVV